MILSRPHSTTLLALSLGMSLSIPLASEQKGENQNKDTQTAAASQHEVELKATEDSSDIGPYETKFLQLAPNRLLVSVDRLVYMLGEGNKVVWTCRIFDMVDSPIVTASGRIYGIAADEKQFSIDPTTGHVKIFGPEIGGSHASFSQIKPYKEEQYLIVENMQFYRDSNHCFPKCPMSNDSLFAWDGEKFLWSTDFPPNAELEVWGNKILAVLKNKNGIIVRQISIPKK